MREHNFRLTALNLRRHEQWSTSSGIETRTLTGEAAFEARINIRTLGAEDVALPAHVAQLRISAALPDEGRYRSPGGYEGRLFACQHDNLPVTQAEVSVWLPQDVFDELWAKVADGDLEIRLVASRGSAEDAASASPASEEGNDATFVVSSIEHEAPTRTPAAWLEVRRGRQLEDALRQLYFRGSGGSQVGRICDELAAGLARIEDVSRRIEQLQVVIELVGEARTTFREPLEGPGEKYYDNAYWLDKPKFESFIASFDEKRQAELKANYSQFWQHCTLTNAVRLGEQAAGPEKFGLRCRPDELEDVAHKYASLCDVHSPTLELALLDALVYSECLGFAQQVMSKTKLFGQIVPAPLTTTSAWHTAREEFTQGIGNLVGECLKIGLTFGAAWLVTQENSTATWVIVTGMSVARWLRKALLWRELNPKVKLGETLSKMTWVSETFKRRDFNPTGVRQHIHALMQEGVSFSPWVLNLLDRRIARDDAAVG
jgi:hypothetical protein